MIKRIASIVAGGILGYIVGIVVSVLVGVVLVLAGGLSVPMVVDAVILFGGIIAGGVLGNWTYDRYWNDWYKDRRKIQSLNIGTNQGVPMTWATNPMISHRILKCTNCGP